MKNEDLSLPCLRPCTDRRQSIMTSVEIAERLFKLKGRGERGRETGRVGGEERQGLRRSQGQEIVWERSRVKVALTCLSIGVH